MEKLIASAIKFYNQKTQEWIIMTGVRHADILYDMHTLGIEYDKRAYYQGFLTNYGNFVNRYEAKLIAIEAKQLIVPLEETYAELFSEDVW